MVFSFNEADEKSLSNNGSRVRSASTVDSLGNLFSPGDVNSISHYATVTSGSVFKSPTKNDKHHQFGSQKSIFHLFSKIGPQVPPANQSRVIMSQKEKSSTSSLEEDNYDFKEFIHDNSNGSNREKERKNKSQSTVTSGIRKMIFNRISNSSLKDTFGLKTSSSPDDQKSGVVKKVSFDEDDSDEGWQVVINGSSTGNKRSSNNKKKHKRKTPEELRNLWKTAIKQQILLIQMEKENKKIRGILFMMLFNDLSFFLIHELNTLFFPLG